MYIIIESDHPYQSSESPASIKQYHYNLKVSIIYEDKHFITYIEKHISEYKIRGHFLFITLRFPNFSHPLQKEEAGLHMQIIIEFMIIHNIIPDMGKISYKIVEIDIL